MRPTGRLKASGALDRAIGLAMLLGCLARHAVRRRRVFTLEMRLAMLPRSGLPIENPVAIAWNANQVPFIEAASDEDLAVALGIVHAHLRLGQLELMRRIAQGRVSELIGSVGVAVDQLLRTLDFGRAVPAIIAALPPPTRAWLEAFVRGLNYHLLRVRPLPEECELLGIQPEPWTVGDVLTLGRLVSADVNWIIWFQLLRFRADDDWPQLWRKLVAADNLSGWTEVNGPALPPHLAAPLRAGSNSFAVAPSRSATGAALIASDPHLSIALPNAWLLAAFKSPSYHAAGLMIPGLPFVALGRNPWIAWGGTSLHAASSDLVVVPVEHPPLQPERTAELAVRWRRSRRILLRESRCGPVVTDVPLLAAGNETLALRWMGHRPSDEITAMLAVNRARSWADFRAALDGFAVPGQNMLYADISGHIGRLMAAHLPRRIKAPTHDMAMLPGDGEAWDRPMTGAELPCVADPPEGFIASANERPPHRSPFIGQHFSPPDRQQRLTYLLASAERLSFDTAARFQLDTQWEAALIQCRQILAWLDGAAVRGLNVRERRLISDISTWDGRYDATSRGALVFEVLCHYLVRSLVPDRRRAAYGAAWGTRRLVWDDVLAAGRQRRLRALRHALHRTTNTIKPWETWGNRHRLRLSHSLALMPVIGRAWRYIDQPVAGSSDTLMKTAHALTAQRHGSRYGSVARHISDLSDLDRNHFVLLGGQDGWLGSTTLLDQVALWQRGEYIALPLRPETAHAIFRHRTELIP
jgi:penicillin amidase